MMMLAFVVLAQFTMIFDFAVLIFMLWALALGESLLVKSWCSLLLPVTRSLSSAKQRLQTGLPLMEMKVAWSRRVS